MRGGGIQCQLLGLPREPLTDSQSRDAPRRAIRANRSEASMIVCKRIGNLAHKGSTSRLRMLQITMLGKGHSKEPHHFERVMKGLTSVENGIARD